MATAIRSGVMPESLGGPYAWPTFQSVKDSVREVHRAVGAARQATEPLAAEAVSRVRQYPLRAVGIAMVAGAVAGSLLGFGFGWFARIRA
jgi:hypothetical protein